MRDIRQGSCPQCQHHEIVQAHPQVFGYHRLEPALAGQVRAADAPGGELNLFVCRRCGLAQWYAAFPDKIPIAAELGTRLLRGPEPAGPYR